MARVVSEFRLMCSGGAPADEVLASLNRSFAEGTMRGMFVTFLYAILDPASGELRVANAGHLPLLLSAPDGGVHWVGSASGPPMGMLPAARYDEETMALAPGETLLFYSDGIVEARGKSGELYGEERLLEAVVAAPRGARTLLSDVLASVQNFTREIPQADDMTLVSLSWAG